MKPWMTQNSSSPSKKDPVMERLQRLDAHSIQWKDLCFLYHGDSGTLLKVSPAVYHRMRHHPGNAVLLRGAPSYSVEGNGRSDQYKDLTDYLASLDPPENKMDSQRGIVSLLSHSPKSIVLFVTNRCNFKCKYCYQWNDNKNPIQTHLQQSDVDTAIDDFFKRSKHRPRLKISFFGGEPLLNFEMVKYGINRAKTLAKEAGKQVMFSLTTNAYLLNPEIIEFLVSEEVHIAVSIDGPKEVHDKNRILFNGRGTFDMVAANTDQLLKRQLKEGAPPLSIRATWSDSDSSLDNIFDYLTQRFPHAKVDVIRLSAHGKKHRGCHFIEKIHEVKRKLQNAMDELIRFKENSSIHLSEGARQLQGLLRKLDHRLHSPNKTVIPYNFCGICRNRLCVSADGNYYPCDGFVGREAFALGSVSDGLNNKRVSNVYEKYLNRIESHCAKCWAKRICNGPCPAQLAGSDGTFMPPNEQDCKVRRFVWEKLLGFYGYVHLLYPT